MATESAADSATKHSVLNSTFPVLLPYDESLFLPEAELQAFLKKSVTDARNPRLQELKDEIDVINDKTSETATSLKRRASMEGDEDRPKKAPFFVGLERHAAHFQTDEDLAAQNKTLTENSDVTNVSSRNPLADLFYDMGENTGGKQLKTLLENAWEKDPLMTLKIIFNARSIHLGKSNRVAAYKALSWLAENHPVTLLTNLRWLVRPVIEKKAPKPESKEEAKQEQTGGAHDKGKAKSEDDDFEMIEVEDSVPTDPAKAHDVRFGVSHGYFKDLLNLVVFAANNQLKFDGDPAFLLNQKPDQSAKGKRTRLWDQQEAKELRHKKREEHHERVVEKLKADGFYRALHVAVARLFADQLKEDVALLKSDKKSDLRKISLAAKWSPTFGEFHDKQTFILSSIAEFLFPNPAEVCPDATNRELYLRHAREAYRKTYSSPLRKALAVVEREIASKRFADINYQRVPSMALDRYTPLFLRKDFDHFSDYIKKVAQGSAKISGATLLPSTLVRKAQEVANLPVKASRNNYAQVKASAEANVTRQVIDGQWKTLVQRVRDSGALNSSIAVCDVSGSMNQPRFKDGTVPMDSSIGLSLLVAEVTAQPFGGGFITFSSTPEYISVGGPEDTRGLVEKVKKIECSIWSMNTNFVSVFEQVILPMALRNNLKQEDMVKQVFVFSDMQFNTAEHSADRWTTSYERIKNKFEASGYEMPRLIFWNLAARATDKPITMEDQNTALVSGYSQGMLKVFLDAGSFEEEGEEEIVEERLEDGDGMIDVKVKKKIDPMTAVRKAVSHKAYGMLEVLD